MFPSTAGSTWRAHHCLLLLVAAHSLFGGNDAASCQSRPEPTWRVLPCRVPGKLPTCQFITPLSPSRHCDDCTKFPLWNTFVHDHVECSVWTLGRHHGGYQMVYQDSCASSTAATRKTWQPFGGAAPSATASKASGDRYLLVMARDALAERGRRSGEHRSHGHPKRSFHLQQHHRLHWATASSSTWRQSASHGPPHGCARCQ